MKVYCFNYRGKYGGGCAIVAANSKEEAYNTLSYNMLLDYQEDIKDYTDIEHCNEIVTLTANVTSPRIIIYKFYTE